MFPIDETVTIIKINERLDALEKQIRQLKGMVFKSARKKAP
jgi:hypothetical protein